MWLDLSTSQGLAMVWALAKASFPVAVTGAAGGSPAGKGRAAETEGHIRGADKI